MNSDNTAPKPRLAGGLPEFLEALDRLYRLIGLGPDEARAATLADAEIFAPQPAQPELAA